MLTLHAFKPFLGSRSPSPFVVKAEALLAMSGQPYQVEHADIRKAPRGKFPVLADGSEVIPDSALIQLHLEQRYGVDYDGHLSAEERAIALAFQRLIEDHLYFFNMMFRWGDHPDVVREGYFGEIPFFIRGLIFKMVTGSVNKTLHLAGFSRHTRADQEWKAEQDVDAIAAHLGDQPYFMGDYPSSIDASVFGMLEGIIPCDLDVPGRRFVMKHNNLINYHARLTKEWFG